MPGAPTLNSATGGQRQRRAQLERARPPTAARAITGYKVYRGTTSGGETLLATLGNVTSYTDTGRRRTARPTTTRSAPSTPSARARSRTSAPRRRATHVPGAPTLDLGDRRQRQRRARLERAGVERRLRDHRLQGLPRHVERRRDAAHHARQRHRATPTPAVDERHDLLLQGHRRERASARARSRTSAPRRPATGDRAGAPTLNAATGGNGSVAPRLDARPPPNGGSRDHRLQGLPRHRERRRDACSRRSATSTSYTDTGLTNGTTYYYKVTAVNAVGEGALSNERSATPCDGARRPDAEPRRRPATAASASSWSAPASNGGSAITGYKVYRGTAAAARRCSRRSATSRATPTPALANGTTYYYKVAAVNARRRGHALERALGDAGDAGRPRRARRRSARAPATAASRSPGARRPRTAAPRSPATGSTAALERRRDAPHDARQRHELHRHDGDATGRPTTTGSARVNAVGEGALSNELSATPVRRTTRAAVDARRA